MSEAEHEDLEKPISEFEFFRQTSWNTEKSVL